MRGCRLPILAAPTALLLSWLLLSCIERPAQIESRAAPVDRSALRSVLPTALPPLSHPIGAVFDREIELLGYNVTPEPAAQGQRVTVSVYYRALTDMTDDWQIFVHCGDESKGQPRFNLDHWPANGRYHTSAWHKGDIILDDWSFTFPTGQSAIDLWTGFYQGDERLPLTTPGQGQTDGANRVRLGAVVAR